MTQLTSIEEWQRKISAWPDSMFRPKNDGPHRIAAFHSSSLRDKQRADGAAARNPALYFPSDTLAAEALKGATELGSEERRTLSEQIATRTALAAKGRVEVFGALAQFDPKFIQFQVAPLLGRESVTHINDVPGPSIFAAPKGKLEDALFASEVVRDRNDGLYQRWQQPGEFYSGGQRPDFRTNPEGWLTPAIQELVETYYRDAFKDRMAHEAALLKEGRSDPQLGRGNQGIGRIL